jgi:hypothetical protein
MRISCSLIFLVVLAGCTTALDRERRCFDSLTRDYLAAQEELLELEAAWRAPGQRIASADDAAIVEIHAASQRFRDAQARLEPTLHWYERLYDRLRLRAEEEEMLADARLLLFTGPAALFYPVVRWNTHAVLWDGADPDAESDPVTRYCTDRLTADTVQVKVEAERDPGPAQVP